MTRNQPARLDPFASFVVEREPGEGYQVTLAEGPRAEEWEQRALPLLDLIGQPEANGPAEYFRWVGPISGAYVGVFVKRMPNGESRFHQEWFQIPKRVSRTTWFMGLAIVATLLVFAAVAVAGRALLVPDRPTDSDPAVEEPGSPGSSKVHSPEQVAAPDARTTKLKNELAASRDLRAKLKEYLSQEGFAADFSASVVDEKRSVKLIADLDNTPPPKETIRLSNIEVAKLLRLLEALDEWDEWAVNHKSVKIP